ncbi:predicted protein [Postia placenta Mad-698-R]|nr:predicted protein [Postia placenta Mad-698-R]
MNDITTKGKKTNRKAKGKTQAASMSVPQSATKEQILRSALNVAVTGGSFIDTRIFCFSRRTHDGIVDRVRPVYANSDTLKIASGFFLSSLGGGWKEQIDSQPSTDCYEYDSDSDLELEDCEDAVPNDDLGELAAPEEPFPEHINDAAESEPRDGVKTEDTSTLAPESSSILQVDRGTGSGRSRTQTLFIKNVAYATLRALTFYVMTGALEFSALSSEGKAPPVVGKGDLYDPPLCSPKSMYRFAEMCGITELQELALKDITAKLSSKNILAELFSTFTSWYPDVQKSELDFFSKKFRSSPEVLNGLSRWTNKMARGDLPHGGDILASLFQQMAVPVDLEPPKPKCPKGHIRTSKDVQVYCNSCGTYYYTLEAWGTSAQMETFREEEREGRMTVVLGGKVLVIDVELSVNRSDPDCPMVTVAGLKTSYAIPNTASGSTTQGSLSLDGFLADRLQAFLTEVQKEPEEQDCLRAERFGRLFSEDLIYLMQLDQLALNEGDGGLRWFSDIDALAQETEKFAIMEAEAIVGCISRAFTHVAPSLFNWRIHIVFDTCLAASLSSPTTNMPPPFTCVSLTTGDVDDGGHPYLGPRFHRRWATLWHNYEPVANAGDRACGQSSEWDVTYRQHANDGIRVPELARSIERYTTLYTSPTRAHPQLYLRLTAPDEPGFILEKVPVHTLKEIWGILEIVKEQCWLNEIISAYTWTPEGLNIGEGLGEDIDDPEATQDDLQAILKGMVEISVAFDPSRPRGVALDVSGAMGADLNSDVLEEYLWWPDTALAADFGGESFSRALARFRASSHPDIEKGLQELASVWELALGDLAKDHAKRLVDFKVMRA